MKCHYRKVKVTAKVYKRCGLSFFISFSLFHVCLARSDCLSLSSFTSLASLHSQSIHVTYETFTKPEYTVNLILSIYMRCHYRNVKAPDDTERFILSFFISFSFHVCHVLFIVYVSLLSLHRPLNTYSLYTRHMKR